MPKGRPKGSKNTQRLEALTEFAIRIEKQIAKAQIPDMENMERLICRLMTNTKIPGVAALMVGKWVEWRYGKPTEKHEHKLEVDLTLGDADRIIGAYFIAAASGAYQASEGDSGKTEEQADKLLPGKWTA